MYKELKQKELNLRIDILFLELENKLKELLKYYKKSFIISYLSYGDNEKLKVFEYQKQLLKQINHILNIFKDHNYKQNYYKKLNILEKYI